MNFNTTNTIWPVTVALTALISANVNAAALLEEVIVTAQKREQSLQEVPISVTALQGENLEAAGIPNMSALADYVPNLYIANAAVNTNIFMRGVGSGNNQGFEQSVGMYIDGIYMGRGRQYRNAFLDIERVEVLRGPQGTLFGRNTVAGAVNITTASSKPGDELDGDIAVSAEENGGFIGEGFLGGSVTEELALRLAFKYRETDGYVDNSFFGDDEPNLEESSYRISAMWIPNERWILNLKYGQSDEKRTGAPSATWLYLDPASLSAQFPNASDTTKTAYLLTDTFFPQFATIAGEELKTYKDNGYGNDHKTLGVGRHPDGDDADVDNFMLNVNYQLGDYSISSLTGWTSYQVSSGADVDWLPLQFISRDDDQDFEQFSQELTITSPAGRFFEFVAGAYYDDSQLKNNRLVVLDANFDGLFPELTGINSLWASATGGLYTADQIARNHYYQLDSTSWAVFFQGTINLKDDLRLNLGVRYTKEDKDVKSRQFLADNFQGYNTPSDSFWLGLIQSTTFNTYAYDYNEDRSTDELIPSVVLQWDVTENSMLYASFSQGFKSGGFTGADDGEPAGLGQGEWPCAPILPGFTVDIESCYDPTQPNSEFEFEDEKVDAYEIGGKHSLFDRSVIINWAAFYTEYDNLQTAVFKGVSFGVTNAEGSEIKGIEIEGRWAATNNLILGLNFAYLDASYKDFKDAPCTAIQLDADEFCGSPVGVSDNDLSGEPTLFASDYTASLTWDYTYPVKNMELFVSGEANYRDDFSSSGDNDPIDIIPDYTKVNLRLGMRVDQWELMAYGRNIFDEEAFVQSFDVPVLDGSHARFMEEGRVFGVRGKYSF